MGIVVKVVAGLFCSGGGRKKWLCSKYAKESGERDLKGHNQILEIRLGRSQRGWWKGREREGDRERFLETLLE